MPVKHFFLHKSAKKHLLKLPIQIHIRVVQAFDQIQINPLIGSKLEGELSHLRKLRIGDYRIIYKFDSKMSSVEIVKIEHRQGVYR